MATGGCLMTRGPTLMFFY